MNNSWIDILPPDPPVEILPVWFWLCITVLLLLIPALYLWYQSAYKKSLRSLNYLQQQLKNNKDIQDIPFAISEIIKRRFSVNNIERIDIPYPPGWNNYKQRLVSSCFRKNKPVPEELSHLLSEAVHWLRQGNSR